MVKIRLSQVVNFRLSFRVTGMEFVWVPEGCFQMGQTEEEKRYLIKEVGEEHLQGDISPMNFSATRSVWTASGWESMR